MADALELKGKKYGKLLVLERVENNKRGNTIWKCKCDCGKETYVEGYLLISNHTKSCGCLIGERLKGKESYNFKSLENEIFDDYKVMHLFDRENGIVRWNCKCVKCGKEKIMRAGNIYSRHGTICECTKKQSTIDSYVGKTFGRLTIITYSHEKNRRYYFNCLCSCGNSKTVSLADLQSGHTKSCGCLSDENRKKAKKSYTWRYKKKNL